MKKWRDILGLLLLILGVVSCMTGVHSYTGTDEWLGIPSIPSLPVIGAGAVVNALAYRALRRRA